MSGFNSFLTKRTQQRRLIERYEAKTAPTLRLLPEKVFSRHFSENVSLFLVVTLILLIAYLVYHSLSYGEIFDNSPESMVLEPEMVI